MSAMLSSLMGVRGRPKIQHPHPGVARATILGARGPFFLCLPISADLNSHSFGQMPERNRLNSDDAVFLADATRVWSSTETIIRSKEVLPFQRKI